MCDEGYERILRRRLKEARRVCRRRIKHLHQYTFSLTLRQGAGELSSYDNHPADLGTETYERSRDVGLLAAAARQLREIDAALDRMRNGEYGRCQACGGSISSARLMAKPTARTCVRCMQQR